VRFTRIVDGGLDPQDRGLVVDLHPVAGHAVAHPPTLGSALGVGDHLGGQGGVELSTEKTEHVFGGQVEGGMTDEVGPDLEEGGTGLEHHVGGDLALVEHPVVAAVAGGVDPAHEGVHHLGEGVEEAGPGPVGEVVAQARGDG
jgi:hypothetical protein